MPYLIITTEAKQAVRAQADGPFYNETAEPAGDGLWRVPIQDLTMERLNEIRFEGESDSDLILRICAGPRRN